MGAPYIYDISRLRVKKNCAPSWVYLQAYTGMHDQQNIKKNIKL